MELSGNSREFLILILRKSFICCLNFMWKPMVIVEFCVGKARAWCWNSVEPVIIGLSGGL